MQPSAFHEIIKHQPLFAGLSGAVGMLALVLVSCAAASLLGAEQKRAGRAAGVAAVIATLAAAIGLVGGLVARQEVPALWSAGLRPDVLRQFTLLGYLEARRIAYMGAVGAALPLLLALGVTWKAGAGRVVAGLAASSALGLGGLGMLWTSNELALSNLEAHATQRVRGALRSGGCDPCPVIAWGIQLVSAERLEAGAPGALARARTCVDDELKAISGGHHRQRTRPCGTSDATTPAWPEDARPNLEGKAMTPEEKEAALAELLESPLAVDPEQRETLEAALTETQAAPTPDAPR